METVVKLGSPFLLGTTLQVWLFLLLPALGAAFGALLFRGTWLRILGAALGGASRDIVIVLLLLNGKLIPTNPYYEPGVSFMLAYFGASAAALMSCLSPYRGKMLLLNSFLGGFAGQFILPYILVMMGRRRQDDQLPQA